MKDKKPASQPRAYSYARYSSSRQALGSSESRQVEQAQEWARSKGLKFAAEVIDKGYSGYHGEHRSRGAFGRFLADVRSGRIPAGSYLVIESMNRLSRETPYDAQGVLRELLDGEIKLVVLYRGGLEIDKELVRKKPRVLADLHQDIEIAHQQSKEKSDMGKRNWRRNVSLIQSGIAVTARCPGWLQLVGEERRHGRVVKHGRYEKHPKNWNVVKEMIKLRMSGVGLTSIAAKLNQKGIRPFQDIYKGKATSGWSDSSVKSILRHPALYGEYVFQSKVDGILPDPVSDYYPPIMSHGEWFLLQRELDSAKKTGGGRRVRFTPNLFDGIIFCGKCGGPMHLGRDSKDRKNSYFRFSCNHYRRKVKVDLPGGQCTHKSMYRASLIEGLVFYYLFARLKKEELGSETVATHPIKQRLSNTEAELAEVEAKIDRGKNRLLEENDDRRFERLQDQLDIEELKAATLRSSLLESQQALAAAQGEENIAQEWENTRILLGALGAAENAEAREQIRLGLHRIVERISVGPAIIPYYITEDRVGLPIKGRGKNIPRYPICEILLRPDKIMITGDAPSAAWQEEVMGLTIPKTPRHLRKGILERKALYKEQTPNEDQATRELMDSLKSVFFQEYDLIPKSDDE